MTETRETLALSKTILLLSLGLLMPSRYLQAMARRLVAERFYPGTKRIEFFLSGRTALVAVLQAVRQSRPGHTVLIPDYVCNILHKAATYSGFSVRTYKTDAAFRVDVADLVQKVRAPEISTVILASIFGTQNNQQWLVEGIRQANNGVFIILDECQNLIQNNQVQLVPGSVVVSSFNRKTIPGQMGGLVCLADQDTDLHPPQPSAQANASHNARMYAWFVRRELHQLARRTICRGSDCYDPPKFEFSFCRNYPFTLAPLPIPKVSLVLAILGMHDIAAIEQRRKARFQQFRTLLARRGIGQIIETERIDVTPYVPFEPQGEELIGVLPLKGPYAEAEAPSRSQRSHVIAFVNSDESATGLRRLLAEAMEHG